MATIREYFDTDPKAMAMHIGWGVASADGTLDGEVIAKVAYDFEANAKYWYFFIPPMKDLSGCLGAIFASQEFAACRLRPDGDGIYVETGHADYSERQTTETLQFTRRVHMYLDAELLLADRASLVGQALARGFYLSIRDREYAGSAPRPRSLWPSSLMTLVTRTRSSESWRTNSRRISAWFGTTSSPSRLATASVAPLNAA